MLSKLILLLGLLIAGLITYFCIGKHPDLFHAAPHAAAPAISQPTEPVPHAGSEAQITTPPSAEKKAPLQDAEFDFRLEGGSVVTLRVATGTEDIDDGYLNRLNALCSAPACELDLLSNDAIADAPWRDDVATLAALLRKHGVRNATLHARGDSLSLTAEVPDQKSADAIGALLKRLEARGIKIESNVEVVSAPEPTTEPIVETESEKPAPAAPKLEVAMQAAAPAAPEPSLEDLQQSRIEATQKEIDTLLRQHPIYFERDSNEITLDSKRILDKIIDLVNKNSEEIARLRIAGHTDASGSAAYNRQLSRKRAEAVREYLIGHHIKTTSLEAVGYGEERPITKNPYDKANRRVEITVEKGAER